MTKIKTWSLRTVGFGSFILLFGTVGGIEQETCELWAGTVIALLCLVVMALCMALARGQGRREE